jgi:hypothetical protein
MANATTKDIKDLTKSIQDLISTFGSTAAKPGARKPAQFKSGPDSDDVVGNSEARRAERKEEEAFKQRMLGYDKATIDATKQLAENQKAWGTEQYKSLDLTEDIAEVTEDMADLNEKYLIAKKAGNKEAKKELSTAIRVLAHRRHQLEVQRENAKAQDKANKLAIQSLASFKEITASLKDPIKFFESAANDLNESMGKRFNASLAAPKKSIMEIATTGLKFGVVAAIAMGVKRAFEMNQELTDMQRTIGLNAEEAHDVHHALQDATISSTVLGATSHDTAAAFESLRDSFGTTVALNSKLLNSQVLLTKQVGMTAEQSANFQDISAGTGKSVEENLGSVQVMTDEYNKQMNASESFRDIQKEVANVSKSTFASYKGNTKALAAAVIQAKKLGMTLEDTKTISSSLLQIEDSVGAEMEANVLTGKHVNMNAARNLALQGDSAGAAAEALRQIGSYDEFMDMNVLQQEALAKAAGMTVDQVVKAGQEEKKRALVGEKSIFKLNKAEKEKLINQGVYKKEQLEALANEEQAASVKERLVQLTDKLMTAFDTMVTNTITPWLEYLESGLEKMDKIVSKTKEFIKQSFPTWVVDLMKNAGTVAKVGIGIAVGFAALRKVGGMISGFLSGKAGDSARKPIYAAIVSGAKKVGGFAGRGLNAAKRFGGGIVDKVKGIGGVGKGLVDKYKTFKSTKKEGGWGAAMKSLFTKGNLAGAATGVLNQTTDTGAQIGDEGPLGTKADPISVQVIGGLGPGPAGNGPAGPEGAGDSGLSGLATDAATSMLGKTKIGKKLGIGSGGMMDSLIGGAVGMFSGGEEGAGGGVTPNGPASPAPSGNIGGGAKAPSPAPSSSGDSGGGGGGLFGGLIDKIKNSKFVGKIGDFAKKLNPLAALKKLFTDKSVIGKLLGKIPKIGSLVSMASTLYSLGSSATDAGSYQDVGSQLVITLGDLGGSIIGGLLGSLGGPAAIVGSILGGMAGSSLAGVIADNVDLSGLGKMVVDILGPSGEKGASPIAVEDALIRPGMPPITFDKGDMILAGTNLQGAPAGSAGSNGTAGAAGANASQGSMSEVAGLLKQILAATNAPVAINIGGKVISEIDSLSTLRRNYVGKMDSAHGAF